MNFGIVLGPVFPGDWSPSEIHQNVEMMAKTAYENNFDGIFASHHYLVGPDTAILEPLTLLSHLLGKFPGMYGGTSVFILPLHHPIEIAERVATLDILSGGKFLFGVGQGYRDIEFRSFGVEKSSLRQRMVEGVQAIRKLWAEDNVTFHGDFFQFDNVSINPKPLQRNGPPIMVGADKVFTVSKVPEVGDYWVVSPRHSKTFLRKAVPAYKAALENQGKPFKGLPIVRELCVANDSKEAEKRIKEAFQGMNRFYQRWGQSGERSEPDFHELKRERLVVGSPQDVVEQIMSYHQEFGTGFMWFRLYWPGSDPQWAVETIQLFGQKVIPAIKKEAPLSLIP
jgi:alkanesulfonate monooxygenase SsuD/methylene tetrahydromethanopterin reductase-like flavin-dependent oxidoreductase (luciferase family)